MLFHIPTGTPQHQRGFSAPINTVVSAPLLLNPKTLRCLSPSLCRTTLSRENRINLFGRSITPFSDSLPPKPVPQTADTVG